MADAVTTNQIADSNTHLAVHLTNVSDGTGESAVIKINKSDFTAPDGAEPASVDIEQVTWAIQGFTSVTIAWDHTADDTALVLTGSGYNDFTFRNDDLINISRTPGLADPRSSGGAGDIVLTTTGAAADASYDITLVVRKASD